MLTECQPILDELKELAPELHKLQKKARQEAAWWILHQASIDEVILILSHKEKKD